jgi:hypothetical protein
VWWWLTVLAVALFGSVVHPQQPKGPAPPGTPGDPKWNRQVRLNDGRTFVTDGGLAMDAAIAKPSVMPSQVLAASVANTLEGYMAAKLKDEFGVAELKKAANGRTYTSPTGLPLNATYIDFLRKVLPAGSLRFRMEGALTPVVILSKGSPVGVLMPVQKAAP